MIKDTAGLSKTAVDEEILLLHENLIKIQDVFYAAKKRSLLILLQGTDYSGKDGTVKKY